jgi:hypothetical protein
VCSRAAVVRHWDCLDRSAPREIRVIRVPWIEIGVIGVPLIVIRRDPRPVDHDP